MYILIKVLKHHKKKTMKTKNTHMSSSINWGLSSSKESGVGCGDFNW